MLNICPNPFNSTTDISFDIPEANNVELTIYDITGIRVAELYKGSMTAGHHVINWNADGLQSGLYMVTLSYDGYSISSRAFYVK
jgi:flagellar hook assembly protein FlgD